MKVARSVAEILSEHTTLALECIDRLYLNVYVPVLQRAAGAAYFFRTIRGCSVPSSALMAPMTQRFVAAIKRYAETRRHRHRVVSVGASARTTARRSTCGSGRGARACSTSAKRRRRRECSALSAAGARPGRPTRGWSTRRRW